MTRTLTVFIISLFFSIQFSYASTSAVLIPNALCNPNLQVSLASNGVGILSTTDIDAGSSSSCGAPTFEVRRTDGCLGTTAWSSTVSFQCCDVSQNITVELRVTDSSGSSSVCSSSVLVIDDLAPQITCPADKTLDCNDPNLSNPFSSAVAFDNCSVSLSFTDSGFTDQCSAGVLLRTWTAQDGSLDSPDASCTQRVTVTHVSDFIVQFPADVALTTCLNNSDNFGEPQIIEDDCELVAVSYTDVFTATGIDRTWTVVNWCIYSVNNPNYTDLGIPQPIPRTYRDDDGFFQYTQQISSTFNDNLAPSITCPSNLTVNCSDPGINDYSLFGTASFADNCDADLVVTNDANFTNCTGGTITRTFTATDSNGNINACTQTITVIAGTCPQSSSQTHTSDFIVQFPADLFLTNCPSSPISAGSPSVVNNDTELVNISFSDDTLSIVSESCYNIVRTWEVINICVYDSSNPSNTDLGFPQPLPRTYQDDGDGYFRYIQSISVIDNQAPIFSSCNSSQFFCDTSDDCEGIAILTTSASDACSPLSALEYSYSIDAFNDGSIDIAGTGDDATGIYPYGTHRIVWEVNDGCGNSSSCFQLFTILDCANPVPVCNNSIVVDVAYGECQTVFASTVLNSATDNCTASSYLTGTVKIRKVGDTSAPSISVDFCDADAGNQFVEVWVEDEAGNADFCVALITVNYTGCPDNILENNNPIINNSYNANLNITSNGTVGPFGNVTFAAGQTICLDPGFEVTQGSIFCASIEACPTPLTSKEENK